MDKCVLEQFVLKFSWFLWKLNLYRTCKRTMNDACDCANIYFEMLRKEKKNEILLRKNKVEILINANF